MSASIAWEGMTETRRLLKSLADKTDNLKPLFEDVGSHLVASTQTRLKDEKRSPDGAPWADYKSAQYAWQKAKKSSGGLLEYSGMLIRSMTYNADSQSLVVGSNKEYAARHQFGGGGIAARPFLGISRKDNEVIKDLIISYYEK